MQAQQNDALKALIDEAGFSAKGLAFRVQEIAASWGLDVRTAHTQIARWLDGQQPRKPTPALIAEALSGKLGRRVTLAEIGMGGDGDDSPDLGLHFAAAPAASVRALTELWTADMHRREFLAAAVAGAALTGPALTWLVTEPGPPPAQAAGRRIGMGEVQAIRATAAMFGDLDNRFGGSHARLAAVQYLSDQVAPLLNGTFSQSVGQALFAAVAEFTLSVAWMGYDSGQHGLARRYFTQALSLTHHAGARQLGASVLSAMSHQANYLGEHDDALCLARAARHGSASVATATVTAQFAAMEARAAARAGDDAGCLRALTAAEAAFERSDPGEDPAWAAYFTASEMADEAAHCLRDLGDWQMAREQAELCLMLAGDEYARSRAFSRIVLAQVLLGQGEVEQAAAAGLDVLPAVADLASVRVTVYMA